MVRTCMGLVPDGRLLVVSPHFDDAALSCAALVARDEPLHLLTVFAGRPDPPQTGAWDVATGFADSEGSMAARHEEELAAFMGTPHRVSTLDLLEEQYLRGRRAAADADAIAGAVGAWLDDGAGTVALPVGAGRRRTRARAKLESYVGTIGGPLPHRDHLFVRDAALAALQWRPEARVLLYEEFPYALGGRGDRVARRVASAYGARAERVEVPVDREAKARRIGAYRSQVPHLMTGHPPLDRPQSLPPEERYWWLVR
jgi:LmbE family N-acetylglucosaminyl deacetylase